MTKTRHEILTPATIKHFEKQGFRVYLDPAECHCSHAGKWALSAEGELIWAVPR